MNAAYRNDIDGLRGFSVLMVMLFHTESRLLAGGYVGVDVFFVISGFVITRMILSDTAQGRFSIVGFFERRVRRLMPAMVLLIATVYVVGWFVVMPASYGILGGSVAAQSIFLSNMFFWRYVGNYFEPVPEIQPLLHTWSLSVEEQFYIFFPFLCFLLLRRRGYWLQMAVLALGCLSLILSVAGVGVAPTLSFYAMPSRVWELMLGAWCALRFRDRGVGAGAASFLSVAGIVAILGSAIFFTEATPFPGAWALLPALGTAAFLVAGERQPGIADGLAGRVGNVANAVLVWRPLVFTGQISYSLYLWHWPVFSLLAHHVLVRPLSVAEEVLAWAAIIGMAVLSWRFIERPFRKPGGVLSRRWLFGVAILVTAGLFAAGQHAFVNSGYSERFPGLAAMHEDLSGQGVPLAVDPLGPQCFLEAYDDWDPEACRLTAKGGIPTLLWGDSYAMHYSPGFQMAAEGNPLTVYQFTSASCAAALDFNTFRRPLCARLWERVPEIVRQQDIRIVVMSSNWFVYLRRGLLEYRQITDTIAALRRSGVEVLMVGQSPLFDFVTPVERRYQLEHRKDDGAGTGRLRSALAFGPELPERLSAAGAGAHYFDPLPGFCDGSECLFYDDGYYLFFDPGHFSHVGAARVVAAMMERLGPVVDRLRGDR
ncbi:MAG: acyltransferase family protein [Pseudomonadota bacterium]|nr:acyltransferase family protein [Pseudomonadota bacterium]